MKSKAYYLDIPAQQLEWLYKEAEKRQVSLGKLIAEAVKTTSHSQSQSPLNNGVLSYESEGVMNLGKILQDHKDWLAGIGGKRADLRGVDLTGAKLAGVDLRGAYLQGAILKGVVLTDAHLVVANLQGANLQDANLQGAKLRNANLQGADLSGAILWGTDLWDTDLDVKSPPVADHNFISAILFRAASNTGQRRLAGLVRISLDWCWEDFLDNCDASEIAWAKKILCDRWDEFKGKFEKKKSEV